MASEWKRLVRFVSTEDEEIRYGEPLIDNDGDDLLKTLESSTLKIQVLDGADMWSLKRTDRIETAKTILSPLCADDVPIVRCIGLNYKTHSELHLKQMGAVADKSFSVSHRDWPSIADMSNSLL